jgi:hypothetical protein
MAFKTMCAHPARWFACGFVVRKYVWDKGNTLINSISSWRVAWQRSLVSRPYFYPWRFSRQTGPTAPDGGRVPGPIHPLRRAVSLLLCFGLATTSVPRLAGANEPGSKIRIAFAGDSVVDNYWSGMTRVVAANSCLRVCPETSRGIAKFSEHEAD